jgi:hypothetical protein
VDNAPPARADEFGRSAMTLSGAMGQIGSAGRVAICITRVPEMRCVPNIPALNVRILTGESWASG